MKRLLCFLSVIFALLLACNCIAVNWTIQNPRQTTHDIEPIATSPTIGIFFTNNDLINVEYSPLKIQYINLTELVDNPVTWLSTCYSAHAKSFIALGKFSTKGETTLLITLSSDGINWKPIQRFVLIYGNPSVACGKNEILLSTGLEVYNSTDGVNWNVKNKVDYLFYKLYYIDVLGIYATFVNIAQVPNLFTSDPKIFGGWAVHQGPPGIPYSGITYGQGNWVVAADTLYYSPDFAGWTACTLPFNQQGSFGGVVFNTEQKLFLAAFHFTQTNGVSNQTFLSSSDGVNWKVSDSFANLPAISHLLIAGNDTTFIGSGPLGLLATANSKNKWNLLSGSFYQNLVSILNLYPVSPSLLACDDQRFLYTSSDGVNWARAPKNCTSYSLKPPFYSPEIERFVSLSQDGQNVLLSTDGIEWTITLNASYHNLKSFSSVSSFNSQEKGGLVVSGDGFDTNTLLISPDGLSWKRVDPSNATSDISGVFSLQSQASVWLAYNRSHNLFISDDLGVTWEATNTHLDPPALFTTSLSSPFFTTNSTIFYIGAKNFTYSPISQVSKRWATYQFNISSTIVGVTIVGNNVVVVLNNDQSLVTSDYINWSWQVRVTPNDGPINAFTTYQNRVVAVGNGGSVLSGTLN